VLDNTGAGQTGALARNRPPTFESALRVSPDPRTRCHTRSVTRHPISPAQGASPFARPHRIARPIRRLRRVGVGLGSAEARSGRQLGKLRPVWPGLPRPVVRAFPVGLSGSCVRAVGGHTPLQVPLSQNLRRLGCPGFPVEGNLQRCMPSHQPDTRRAEANLRSDTNWRGGPQRAKPEPHTTDRRQRARRAPADEAGDARRLAEDVPLNPAGGLYRRTGRTQRCSPDQRRNRMPTTNPATMTVSQAATVLGISRSSAYECVRLGSIPSLRLGRRIVIPRRALDELLASVQLDRPATA
jgi:excisionase family DNA binding protein